MKVDYSLYLVTDPHLPGDRDLADIVSQAIKGGVGMVQYRDKISDTGDLIRIAKSLLNICRNCKIPLIINDRIDVALAIGADGVHIGQSDMDLPTVRKLLGNDAIIGVSCSNIDEARSAASGGANYLGIGTMFATPTKKDTKSIIGTNGTRSILETLSVMDSSIATVAIGGINAGNVRRAIIQSHASSKGLDGVAVVSAIIAAENPLVAAQELLKVVKQSTSSPREDGKYLAGLESLMSKVPQVIKTLSQVKPLCHNMTNLVVQNLAANVAIAIGASPIMSNYGGEAKDLAKAGGSLVINMGTVTHDSIQSYLQALHAYNLAGGPVLLDPVGAGATQHRRAALQTLMSGGYFDVIKGNLDEIKAVLGESTLQQKGVDSVGSSISDNVRARIVKRVAQRERNIVVMTGVVDFLSNGIQVYSVKNGHAYLGQITGSGCTLGTTIASCLAVEKEDKLLAVLSSLLLYEIAAERAAMQVGVNGPGTFVPAFLDALYAIREESSIGNLLWVSAARVEEVLDL